MVGSRLPVKLIGPSKLVVYRSGEYDYVRLQILPEQRRIQFGPKRYLQAPEIADHAGAFLNGLYRPQVRVDATQHCLSAMLKEAAAESKDRLR